jgi:hypothetical protein
MWRHLAFIILKKWLKGFGTIAFRDSWDIDQIMVSQSLIKTIFPPINTGRNLQQTF